MDFWADFKIIRKETCPGMTESGFGLVLKAPNNKQSMFFFYIIYVLLHCL